MISIDTQQLWVHHLWTNRMVYEPTYVMVVVDNLCDGYSPFTL